MRKFICLLTVAQIAFGLQATAQTDSMSFRNNTMRFWSSGTLIRQPYRDTIPAKLIISQGDGDCLQQISGFVVIYSPSPDQFGMVYRTVESNLDVNKKPLLIKVWMSEYKPIPEFHVRAL